MEEIDVPSHFLCPISLQLMRDPVTVSTGITYDRESIERWLYSCKNMNQKTCPVTKQVLLYDTDLTPNHTLRRLIQAWCALNASRGVERIPTPKPPVVRTQIFKLLSDAKEFPHLRLKSLGRLKSIALESQMSKKYLEDAGAVEFLVSVIKKDKSNADDALSILCHLEISETGLKCLSRDNNFDFVMSIGHFLKIGNCQSRAYAIILLKSIYEVADPVNLISVQLELFIGIVHVLQDQISHQASKTALKLLVELCPWGRNRIKAVEASAVMVLLELLLNTSEKRACELILHVLDHLCGCAEGRAELLRHGAGLAIVSKKILRVSHAASDRAVRILSSVSRFSAAVGVLQEMLQVGVVSKLCLVLQVDTSYKTKERAREILKLHSRVWKKSSCIPAHLFSSYPSS